MHLRLRLSLKLAAGRFCVCTSTKQRMLTWSWRSLRVLLLQNNLAMSTAGEQQGMDIMSVKLTPVRMSATKFSDYDRRGRTY
jgi:hypothetical protein